MRSAVIVGRESWAEIQEAVNGLAVVELYDREDGDLAPPAVSTVRTSFEDGYEYARNQVEALDEVMT